MIAIVFILIMVPSLALAAADSPQDFAYGMAIHADGQEALYEVEIPPVLYRGVSRKDLGDVRIFNGQGEVVPHALKPRAVTSTEGSRVVSLPVFPLMGQADAKLEDLLVRIDKRSNGTIVSVHGGTKASAAKRQLRGYLLDASALKQSVKALRFEWQSDTEGFVGKVRVEGSDDLSAWNRLVDHAAMVQLTFGGHRLEQNRVDLRAAKYRYLRISWPENQKPLESLRAFAELTASTISARRVWQKITGESVSGKTGEYSFDIGGPFPFDRLRIELPQVNSLVQVQILARDKSAEEWHPVTSAIAYRLRNREAEVTSPEILLASGGQRYWLLRVDQKGGGVGAGVPAIEIGWVPQMLIFASRGNGPFLLAYGNSRAKASVFAIDSLIPGYKTDAAFRVKSATLGEPTTLAGPARLRAQMDYKKWAVWMVLLLGVAALGWMAYRLFRQVAKESPASEHVDDAK
jgi:Protein of unknown function (DUF3999)